MSIKTLKADNLIKLLEGISLLEDSDQEQIISVVDALDFAYEKGSVETDTDPCKKVKIIQ